MEGWRREMASWLAEARFPRGGRVLELGCGNGARQLAVRGLRLPAHRRGPLGVSAIRWARESFLERGLAGEFHCEDISRGMSRFEDRRFHLVIDGNCLHCVLGEARPKAFAAIRRVLMDDGVLIVEAESMYGEPRSAEVRASFDEDAKCIGRDGRPYRYLPIEQKRSSAKSRKRRLSIR